MNCSLRTKRRRHKSALTLSEGSRFTHPERDEPSSVREGERANCAVCSPQVYPYLPSLVRPSLPPPDRPSLPPPVQSFRRTAFASIKKVDFFVLSLSLSLSLSIENKAIKTETDSLYRYRSRRFTLASLVAESSDLRRSGPRLLADFSIPAFPIGEIVELSQQTLAASSVKGGASAWIVLLTLFLSFPPYARLCCDNRAVLPLA